MTRMRTTRIYTLDDRQLALLVRMCVATCLEALRATTTSSYDASNSARQHALEKADLSPQKKQTSFGFPPEPSTEAIDRMDEAHGKLLMTIPEAARTLSVGRTLMYELVRRAEIASVTIGRVRRIPRPALEAFVRRRVFGAADGQDLVGEAQHARKERDHVHQTRES
jgi:excisionase family DNA binding protein